MDSHTWRLRDELAKALNGLLHELPWDAYPIGLPDDDHFALLAALCEEESQHTLAAAVAPAGR